MTADASRDAAPSLDLAYELAMRSYDAMAAQIESANRHLDAIQSLAVTLTLAVPVVAASFTESLDREVFRDETFVAALTAFGAGFVVTLSARAYAGLTVLDARALYDFEWYAFAPSDFQITAMYWAALHMRRNQTLVFVKSWAAIAAALLLVLEAALLILWLANVSGLDS